jgi:hypothetical protein
MCNKYTIITLHSSHCTHHTALITLQSSHCNHHTAIITLHCRHGCIRQRVACRHHGARLADRLCVPQLESNVFVLMHLQHFIQHILLSTLDARAQSLRVPLFHICICRRGFRCRSGRKWRVRHYRSHVHLVHHHCEIVDLWFCARQCCVLFCLCPSLNFRANSRACFFSFVFAENTARAPDLEHTRWFLARGQGGCSCTAAAGA